jgi:hypothetical protein
MYRKLSLGFTILIIAFALGGLAAKLTNYIPTRSLPHRQNCQPVNHDGTTITTPNEQQISFCKVLDSGIQHYGFPFNSQNKLTDPGLDAIAYEKQADEFCVFNIVEFDPYFANWAVWSVGILALEIAGVAIAQRRP